MKKNIIVLCFGRSGSTNFCDAFVENENLNYINAAEIFCRGKSFDIVEQKKKNFIFLTAEFTDKDISFEEQYKIFQQYNTQNKPVIFKMWVGWHLHYLKEDFYKSYLEKNHVIWLFRKDIVAQGISGRLTDPRFKSLKHLKKIKINPFHLEFNPTKDIDWKVNQLEKFIDNMSPIDNLIISEDIFNNDNDIEKLRSLYGINFFRRTQDNPDYLKRELILNYDDIQEEMIKLGYVSRINVALNKLRFIVKSTKIIKNVIGKL